MIYIYWVSLKGGYCVSMRVISGYCPYMGIRMKISIITDISIFQFYGYIRYISEYFDIKYSDRKLIKTYKNIK